MKIESSAINLASSHSALTHQEASETLRTWIGDQRPDFEGTGRPAMAATMASISANGRLASQTAAPIASSETAAMNRIDDDVENDPRLMLLRLMVEMITGRRINLTSAKDMTPDDAPVAVEKPDASADAGQVAQPPQRAGFGIEYDRHEVSEEIENSAFHADGVVRTSDGKEIKFQLDLVMTRSFREESNVSLRAGDGVRKDPLVINFNGDAAQLRSQTFSFDLDGDGTAEKVPLLSGSNSGYIALDINGNNKIDSGKELFGARTGNGFAELAAYDKDGNGWIDDNDPVFSSLKVWTPTADGKGTMTSLKDRGVGALFLGNVQSPFSLKDGANRDLGAVRATGAYLMENGSVGSLQQIDLVV